MRDTNVVLIDWYEGEIGGEAWFWQLAEQSEPESARKWLALAQVEATVAARLAEVLVMRGLQIPSPQNVAERAIERSDSTVGKSWQEMMHWLQAIAVEALQEMEVEAAQLPSELSGIGALVVRHEAALAEFAQRELAGRGADSLQPIQDFLDYARAGGT